MNVKLIWNLNTNRIAQNSFVLLDLLYISAREARCRDIFSNKLIPQNETSKTGSTFKK